MRKWLNIGIVVLLILTLVTQASIACKSATATPVSTVKAWLNAYAAQNAAAMVGCEQAY